MSEQLLNPAAQEELYALRAEVARLRAALEQQRQHAVPVRRGLLETDPDAPGLKELWRGERGIVWQMFVQGVVAINAALAVIAGIAIIH
jgi:hypothetical protein